MVIHPRRWLLPQSEEGVNVGGYGGSASTVPRLDPLLDVGDEDVEITESLQGSMHAPDINVGILMHQHVPETRESLQARRRRRRKDAPSEQAPRNLAILVDRFLKLRREDVGAHVEERFGCELQASLHCPAKLPIPLELIEAHWSPRPQLARCLADLQQLPPDDLRLDRHGVPAPVCGGRCVECSAGAPCRDIGGWSWSRRRTARIGRDTPDRTRSR